MDEMKADVRPPNGNSSKSEDFWGSLQRKLSQIRRTQRRTAEVEVVNPQVLRGWAS